MAIAFKISCCVASLIPGPRNKNKSDRTRPSSLSSLASQPARWKCAFVFLLLVLPLNLPPPMDRRRRVEARQKAVGEKRHGCCAQSCTAPRFGYVGAMRRPFASRGRSNAAKMSKLSCGAASQPVSQSAKSQLRIVTQT